VIKADHIALNAKLAVFTVISTSEPRVVRLYPTTSCSCPARSNCYHIMAAQMSIGMSHETSKKATLNLTQLRKNTRKCPDKTSGRKRPRLTDVEVVPAGDHDEAETAQLQASINRAPTAVSTSSSVNRDLCQACGADLRRRRVINWVCCDECNQWYHTSCVHISSIPDRYVCGQCE